MRHVIRDARSTQRIGARYKSRSVVSKQLRVLAKGNTLIVRVNGRPMDVVISRIAISLNRYKEFKEEIDSLQIQIVDKGVSTVPVSVEQLIATYPKLGRKLDSDFGRVIVGQSGIGKAPTAKGRIGALNAIRRLGFRIGPLVPSDQGAVDNVRSRKSAVGVEVALMKEFQKSGGVRAKSNGPKADWIQIQNANHDSTPMLRELKSDLKAARTTNTPRL